MPVRLDSFLLCVQLWKTFERSNAKGMDIAWNRRGGGAYPQGTQTSPMLHRTDFASCFAFCRDSLFGCVFRFSPGFFVQSIRFLRSGGLENLPMIHLFTLASFPVSW